jgi:hypothetical protein
MATNAISTSSSRLFLRICVIGAICYQINNSFNFARLVFEDSSALIHDDPIATSEMGHDSVKIKPKFEREEDSVAIKAKLNNDIPISKSSSGGKLPTWMKGNY